MIDDTNTPDEIIDPKTIGEAVENLIEQKIDESIDNVLPEVNTIPDIPILPNVNDNRFLAIETWLDGLQTKIEGFETWIQTQTQLLSATQDQIKMLQQMAIQPPIVEEVEPSTTQQVLEVEPGVNQEPVANEPDPVEDQEPPPPDYSNMRQKHRPKEARDYL